MSRKLAFNQRNWVPREQETYAIILALKKWESWIGLHPVLVLIDHKGLESWAREVLDVPSGSFGRRARCHQILSKYDIQVGYRTGKENLICEILSRWAYPASEALRAISIHGSKEDDAELLGIIEKEVAEERACMLFLRDQPCPGNLLIRRVITRSGRSTNPVNETENEVSDSDSKVSAPGGMKLSKTLPLQRKRAVQASM